MMPVWLSIVITLITAVLASSGLWTFLQSRSTSQNAMRKLILSLAYDKLATVGMHHIERGWITKDEYEEFVRELYLPYRDCGGNGVGEQIMSRVAALPFRAHNRYVERDTTNAQ